MEANITENVSKLSQIPVKMVAKLSDLVLFSIIDAFNESELAGDDITKLMFKFGELDIYHKNNEIKFKFIPDAKFEGYIRDIINQKPDIFQKTIEASLATKLNKLYKDLL